MTSKVLWDQEADREVRRSREGLHVVESVERVTWLRCGSRYVRTTIPNRLRGARLKFDGDAI